MDSLRSWFRAVVCGVTIASSAGISTVAQEPFRFRGITPGVTGEAELVADGRWGPPRIRQATQPDGSTTLEYAIEGYREPGANVFVTVRDGVVRTIDIRLPRNVSATQAANAFGLGRAVDGGMTGESLTGVKVDPSWTAVRYSHGACVLFLDTNSSAAEGGVQMMRFFSAPPGAFTIEAGREDPAVWRRFTADDRGVSLEVPPDWMPLPNSGIIVLNLGAPGFAEARTTSAFVTIAASEKTAERYLEDAIATVKKADAGALFGPIEVHELAGRRVLETWLVRTFDHGRTRIFVRAMQPRSSEMLTIQAQCLDSEVARRREELFRILDSFQLLERDREPPAKAETHFDK